MSLMHGRKPKSAMMPGRDSALHRGDGAIGPPAPTLPGPVDAVGPGAGHDLVDLACGEELDVAHGHGLHLQLGVELEVDRDEHRLPDRGPQYGGAVAAHQDGAAR